MLGPSKEPGKRTTVAPSFNTEGAPDMRCALCGQCITHCPTGALTARDDCDKVFDAIADDQKR